MKRVLSILAILLFYQVCFAQQDAQFTHNMFNHATINPGADGYTKDILATIIARNQWMGIDKAPKTLNVNINAPLQLLGKHHNVGLSVVGDILGFNTNTQIKGSYAYDFKLWRGRLGIGIELGLINNGLSGATWKFPQEDESSQLAAEGGKMVFDMGFGFFYNTKKLYFGLSSSHLNQPEVKYEIPTTAATDNDPINPSYRRHYFLTAGYSLQTPFPLLELQPSIFAKYDGAATQFSINANVLYNKKFWVGVTYRNLDSFIALVGIELINGIKFGVAYDVGMTKLTPSLFDGTVEIMLNYQFNLDIRKQPQKYRSVRKL